MEVGSRSGVLEASSSGALTQQQKERAVDAVVFQVLDNPSLREEILKRVIFGKDGVDRKAACNLRLVHSSWNDSVVGILRKAHEALFLLRSSDTVTVEDVERFVETFSAAEEIMGSVPPLAIPNFGELELKRPEKLQRFSNCLTRCGGGLIHLGFKITEKGRPFQNPPLPTNLSLPRLRELDIVLYVVDLADRQSEEQGEMSVEQGDKLSAFLIKSVFNNATALEEFNLVIYPPVRSQFTVFDSVILPPSITKIEIGIMGGTTQPLEILAKSPLPNLELLGMVLLNDGQFSDGLLYRILDNCRRSLKTFVLCRIAEDGQQGSAHVTRFPVMEQLVELHMYRVNIEPDLGRDSLEKYFPKMHTLSLPTESIKILQKWVGTSPVPGVTNLRLSLWDNPAASLNGETMQRVNFGFPNLRSLAVTVSSENSSGLEFIFREMRQLTELHINVKCNLEQSTSSHKWDSLLTGIPVDVIVRSRADPEFWEKNELEDENLASIKNLTELKKLKFEVAHGQLLPMHPSISDFAFNCALLRMPKLVELRLGRVSSHNVSEEMIEKWTSGGRSLTFY